MNKKLFELNRKLADLQALTEKVLKEIEEVKREETWPNLGDHYWIITSDGGICKSICINDGLDHRRMNLGCIFRTKEEARFELERLKVTAELKKFTMRPLDWRANRYDGERYYIYLSGKNEIKINRAIGFVHSTLYFESPEKVKEAIAVVGESRVKKYYFEVDEE